jgi:hypothetical protein
MQILPAIWKLYGDGGNIMNPADAIPAAARILVANGAPGNLQQALLAYNHSASYVTEVLNQAAAYTAGASRCSPPPAAPSASRPPSARCPPAPPGRSLAYAEAQLGKPDVFSGGPGGQVTVNPRVCPAQKADAGNGSGATRVVQATLDPEQRCVAAAAILYAAAQLGKAYLWEGPGLMCSTAQAWS